jgi:hypothetical protein
MITAPGQQWPDGDEDSLLLGFITSMVSPKPFSRSNERVQYTGIRWD